MFMKLRDLGLITALVIALTPRPAQAQGEFIKSNLKRWIEKTGVYVSASTRTAIDDGVDMGPSIGIGLGFASERQHSGKKYPFSYSTYAGNLETNGENEFGRIRARQIMSGFGYSWVHGKLVYGGQLGLGYSFNHVTLNSGVAQAFNVQGPVSVEVSNSWVFRPMVKAEYFVHPKLSLRTQLSYTITDPDVVIHTATQDYTHDWNTNHLQLSFAVGVFPLRK
jgi:hypothetical protein